MFAISPNGELLSGTRSRQSSRYDSVDGLVDGYYDRWHSIATVPAGVMRMGATRRIDTFLSGEPIWTRWGYVRNIT